MVCHFDRQICLHIFYIYIYIYIYTADLYITENQSATNELRPCSYTPQLFTDEHLSCRRLRDRLRRARERRVKSRLASRPTTEACAPLASAVEGRRYLQNNFVHLQISEQLKSHLVLPGLPNLENIAGNSVAAFQARFCRIYRLPVSTWPP